MANIILIPDIIEDLLPYEIKNMQKVCASLEIGTLERECAERALENLHRWNRTGIVSFDHKHEIGDYRKALNSLHEHLKVQFQQLDIGTDEWAGMQKKMESVEKEQTHTMNVTKSPIMMGKSR